MNAIRLLMQRDRRLLYAKANKKFIVVGTVLLFILLREVNSAMASNASIADLFTQLLGGVRIETMKENALAFPYVWFLFTVIPVLFIYDFLRDDLYGGASSIVVQLSKRSFFLFSKWLVVFSLVCAYVSIIVILIFTIGSIKGLDIGILSTICSIIYFWGLGTLFCSTLFICLTLWVRETTALLILFIALCSGLANPFFFLPTSHFMWVRHTSQTSFIVSTGNSTFFTFSMLLIFAVAGCLIINKVDIFTSKNKE